MLREQSSAYSVQIEIPDQSRVHFICALSYARCIYLLPPTSYLYLTDSLISSAALTVTCLGAALFSMRSESTFTL